MKGKVVINPYLVPEQSVHQAQRLVEEFNKLGVQVEVVTDGFTRAGLTDNALFIEDFNADFVIYLDKDKYLSEILEKKGVRLFNKHNAVRVCDDKAQTYIALESSGVKMPDTIFGGLCYRQDLPVNEKFADKIIEKLSLPVIVKECFGSMGKGVYKADDRVQLLEIMEKVKLKPHLFQEYIDGEVGVDTRVIVIGKKAVGAMERRNLKDFRSNVGVGGCGIMVDLSPEIKKVAESCASVLDLDYCGVDLLKDKKGNVLVCEVNSNAFFSEFEKVTGINVAKTYAEHVVKVVEKERNKN